MPATFANDILQLIFNAQAIANIADNAGSSPLTNLYVALHTADPSSGNQETSEATYTGYGRVAVARTSSGWTVSSNEAENAVAVTFPACTGGTNTITYFSIGTKTTGNTGLLLYVGELTASLAVSNGITPQAAINALTVTQA
jgi:hypothetical protein